MYFAKQCVALFFGFLLSAQLGFAEGELVIEGSKERSPIESLKLDAPEKSNDYALLNSGTEESIRDILSTPSYWVDDPVEPEVDAPRKN